MTVSAGGLRWIATRMAAPTAQDAVGQRSAAFTAAGTFPCELRNDQSAEMEYADGVVVRRMWVVRARWQAVQNCGLTERDRLSVDGRILRINSIVNVQMSDRSASIMCEELN